jgi:molybdopterin-binding protein
MVEPFPDAHADPVCASRLARRYRELMLIRQAVVAWCLAGLMMASTSATWAADRLILLEGPEATGVISAIDEAGKLSGEGVPAGLDLNGLRKVQREVPAAASAKPAVVLDLVGGGSVKATSATIANEKFTIKWALGDDLTLPIDAVRAVRLRPDVKDENFAAALAKPSTDNDRLFVEIEGKLSMLTGLVESLTADKVVFQYEGQQQTVGADKLYGIVMAQAGEAKPNSGVLVELSEGSLVAGAVKSLADDKLTLTVGASSVVVPWPSVRSLAVRSARLSFLSDIDPIRVNETRLVTLPAPWQRDQNVQRKTLMLGDRKFDKGLGTHAASELAYNLDGAFDGFAAVIGLDAAAEGKGDCVFVVSADGKELLRQRMRGSEAAKEIKLDVRGVKELVLTVEPGEDLDLGDLADWADARVVRQK